MKKAEQIEERDVVKGRIEAIDENGNVIPEGPSVEETSLGIDIIKDKKIKKQAKIKKKIKKYILK